MGMCKRDTADVSKSLRRAIKCEAENTTGKSFGGQIVPVWRKNNWNEERGRQTLPEWR